MSKETSCLHIALEKFRKKVGKCGYTERDRKVKPVWKMLTNLRGSCVKGTLEVCVLFLSVLSMSEIRAFAI